MKYLTKDQVLEAFAMTNEVRRNPPDAALATDDSDNGDTPLPELIFDFFEHSATIQLVYSNERSIVTPEDEAMLTFLLKHASEIPEALIDELRREIFDRSRSTGDICSYVWIYELDLSTLRKLHDVLGTNDNEELQRKVESAIPIEEMTRAVEEDSIFGFGELRVVDCSPSSQAFHAQMLSIGAYPTICYAEDNPDSQMRAMYGDERFESFTEQDWDKFSFDYPEP